MGLFELDKLIPIGKVQSVDTSVVVIRVEDELQLSKLQVNHMVAIRSTKAGQILIGMVNKIMRKYGDVADLADGEDIATTDLIKVTLIGTFLDRIGEEYNKFKRTLESVPAIDSECYCFTAEMLTDFMSVISGAHADMEHPLCIGTYSLDDHAMAYLDGNKFFQRHAVIVGSTGSGKSYTVANLIERLDKLPSCNALVFDIHGEYTPLSGSHILHYKIAGPTDDHTEHTLFLPYWLLTYEEMLALMLDRSDNNAPNQAMVFSQAVMEGKQTCLDEQGKADSLPQFTLDSPIPYRLQDVLSVLNAKNIEMVPGARGDKQGDFFGKLSRFIQRLSTKIQDRRMNFLFSENQSLLEFEYLERLAKILMAPGSQGGGIKIIDFSEVPSDVLPLIVSLIARLVFTIQQWTDKESRHPIAFFCDEAHLYIPAGTHEDLEDSSLKSFERIAKEGRKYGVGLVVITQRPSEVNHTVLSQSSNFLAMRLTNSDDQNVIKKLLPDSLGNFSDLLPILDVGEAIVVGDASMLPSRILIDTPEKKPDSATVRFWDKWSLNAVPDTISDAVQALRKQSR